MASFKEIRKTSCLFQLQGMLIDDRFLKPKLILHMSFLLMPIAHHSRLKTVNAMDGRILQLLQMSTIL
jgi:hypothetical protein